MQSSTPDQTSRPTYPYITMLQPGNNSLIPVHLFYFLAGAGLTLANTSTHIANSLYVLVDVSVTAIPVRIAHVLHVLVFAITYVAFTIIYWAAGGTSADGNTYIYSVIDYGNTPSKAADWLIGVFVALTFLHFAMYALYRLRVFVSDLRRRHRVGDVSVESAKRTPDKKAEEFQMA